MSQYQKNADNMVLRELEKQKAREKQLDAESKRIAEAVRPQTTIDDLVHQAADQVAHQSEPTPDTTPDKPKTKGKGVEPESHTETLSETKKAR